MPRARQDFEYSASTTSSSPSEEATGWLTWGTWINLALLLLCVVPLLFFKFRPPVQQQQAAQVQLEKLISQRDALREKRDHLQIQNDLIRHDKEYLEVMARDRLQMQKEGEVILRFED
jgi:cell division protein FtsB